VSHQALAASAMLTVACFLSAKRWARPAASSSTVAEIKSGEIDRRRGDRKRSGVESLLEFDLDMGPCNSRSTGGVKPPLYRSHLVLHLYYNDDISVWIEANDVDVEIELPCDHVELIEISRPAIRVALYELNVSRK
jgi:hypothetical protein